VGKVGDLDLISRSTRSPLSYRFTLLSRCSCEKFLKVRVLSLTEHLTNKCCAKQDLLVTLGDLASPRRLGVAIEHSVSRLAAVSL
jgi:hypothetical protein